MTDKKHKSKSNYFSIFLLKDDVFIDVKSGENSALAENSGCIKVDIEGCLKKEKAIAYISKMKKRSQWYIDYWGLKTDNIVEDHNENILGCIIFLKVKERWMAISHGYGFQKINDDAIEQDFGLVVTLNSIDPHKIRQSETSSPSKNSRAKYQLGRLSDFTFFDFERDESIVKSLTGKTKDTYNDYINNITGNRSVRISTKFNVENFMELCEFLLKRYKSDEYKTKFPNILNLRAVKDKEIINALDKKLIDDINKQSNKIELLIPDLLDYKEIKDFLFIGVRDTTPISDISLQDYYECLCHSNDSEKSTYNITLEKLKKQKVEIRFEDGRFKRYTLYKCISYDCKLTDDDKTFYLSEGSWYKAENSYIESLDNNIDNHCINKQKSNNTHPNLLDWDLLGLDEQTHNEGEYNKATANKTNALCLDKKDISPKKHSQVEPCDILSINKEKESIDLIHVKVYSGSATLSHLFAQGENSLILLKSEKEAKLKLKEIIKTELKKEDEKKEYDYYASLIENDKFVVTFGILTTKDVSQGSKNLPLFSKITLNRTLKSLEISNVDARVYFIRDIKNAY